MKTTDEQPTKKRNNNPNGRPRSKRDVTPVNLDEKWSALPTWAKTAMGVILLLITLSGYSQCTPTLTGDTTACAGVHRYQTDTGMTGYTWNVQGGTATYTENYADVTWTDTAGYVRVTYSGCGWNTMIVGRCTTTGIQEHIKPTARSGVWDLLGRPTTEHGLYIKNGVKCWRP
jgi:hypothetical protein